MNEKNQIFRGHGVRSIFMARRLHEGAGSTPAALSALTIFLPGNAGEQPGSFGHSDQIGSRGTPAARLTTKAGEEAWAASHSAPAPGLVLSRI